MDFSEKWGKDVETATALALDELKCSKDEVNITVLEEPSRGFLGIGSKLAKVRVEKIEVSENDKTEEIEVAEEVKETVTEETVENEISEVASKKLIRPDNMKEIEEHPALSFLKETTEKMGLELSFKAYADDNNVFIDIAGKDAGTIIGKRGQTLDAIQYLTSLAVNKKSEDYVRVVLDAENYRSKREKTLERLAHRLADKVVRTKRSVKLEPMNPYERMVIHAALVNSPKVKTRSEGEEPYRRVVIELK